MLFIIEMIMFIAGIWAIVSGRMPNQLFQILFGKGEYSASSRDARLVGLLLISPLPIAFVGGFIIGILFGQDGLLYAAIFEIIILISVGIIAAISARRFKNKPVDGM